MLLIFDWPKSKIHLRLIEYVTCEIHSAEGGIGRQSRATQMILS